jgi:hypothetical protein
VRGERDRFWSQVARRGPTQCWVWTGRRDGDGYGRFFDGWHDVAAHRVAYQRKAEWTFGRLTHTCGNRACCNPGHLQEVAEISWEPRYWSKVAQRGPTECWEWTGARSAGGYGVLLVQGRTRYAHQLALELGGRTSGTWSYQVGHNCDNRGCVNPAHLVPGAPANAGKLDDEEAEDIRRRCGKGELQSRLAAEYGVSRSMVSRIAGGSRW